MKILLDKDFLYLYTNKRKKYLEKDKEKIGRASLECLSIVIEGQHPRCLWRSLFVPKSP